MKITLLTGYHLTATHRNGIRQMIAGGFATGRMGRTDYFVTPQNNGTYKVKIVSNERNCIGADLKPDANYYTIAIN